MKRILTSAFVALTLFVSCGKDGDSHTSNTPDKQEVKKIKEVQATFLRRVRNDSNVNNEIPYSYTLIRKTISYEYDVQGRVSKMIQKEEGKDPKEVTISYETGKMIVNSEGSDRDHLLNNQGYLSQNGDEPILYDEKGQLSKWFQTFHWENGNLSQIIEKEVERPM